MDESEERLEKLRIASAERKWKAELKVQAKNEQRSTWHDHLNRNDGISFAIYAGLFLSIITACICALTGANIIWHHFMGP